MAVLPDLPRTEAAIVEMTNAFRKESRLSDLKLNPALAAAARAFAEYLARTGKFAHQADGRQPQQRAEAQGYKYCMVAENLALNLDTRGFETRALAREAIEGWKNSPGHRANMLHRNATDIGVAVARAPGKDPKFISVQLFGRPQALARKVTIENRTGAAVPYAFGEEKHDIPPRTIVTHTRCDAEGLHISLPGSHGRFEPENGDRYIIQPAGISARVILERR